MSWQRPPEEVDAQRLWFEAITHAVMEVCDKMGAVQHHSHKIHEAYRRLALQREWVSDTGGET